MYAIIGFLLLAATVAPSSVYFFNFAESAPQRVVQLHIVCYDDAISLNDHPLIAADALIDFATEYGRTVSRSKFNIASQIQGITGLNGLKRTVYRVSLATTFTNTVN